MVFMVLLVLVQLLRAVLDLTDLKVIVPGY